MKLLRKLITLLLVLAMIGVGTLFALQNQAPVPLDVLVYTFSPQSLALWVLGAFALGGVVGMLVSSAIMVRLRASLGASRRQLEKTRLELAKLRDDKPVADAA
ncbi:MAG: hypothetical protein Hals2KO_20800 [Halioglobus sp.]